MYVPISPNDMRVPQLCAGRRVRTEELVWDPRPVLVPMGLSDLGVRPVRTRSFTCLEFEVMKNLMTDQFWLWPQWFAVFIVTTEAGAILRTTARVHRAGAG